MMRLRFAQDVFRKGSQKNPIRLAGGAPTAAFAQQVAAAYSAAPVFDQKAVPGFAALRDSTRLLYRQVAAKVRIEFVSGQPYPSEQAMRNEVQRTGVLRVSADFNTHPFFDSEDNLKFRAVHDWCAHLIPGAQTQPRFDQRGELLAYNRQAKLVTQAARPALFTEVVGQAMFATVFGRFPEQKIAVLPGFDFDQVGIIKNPIHWDSGLHRGMAWGFPKQKEVVHLVSVLGSGTFTEAYLGEDGNAYLSTDKADPARQLLKIVHKKLLHSGKPELARHFPTTEFLGRASTDRRATRQPVYAPFHHGPPAKVEFYEDCLFSIPWRRTRGASYRDTRDYGLEYLRNTPTWTNEAGPEEVEVMRALSYLSQVAPEGYLWDFHAGNFAWDGSTLILLDPLYAAAEPYRKKPRKTQNPLVYNDLDPENSKVWGYPLQRKPVRLAYLARGSYASVYTGADSQVYLAVDRQDKSRKYVEAARQSLLAQGDLAAAAHLPTTTLLGPADPKNSAQFVYRQPHYVPLHLPRLTQAMQEQRAAFELVRWMSDRQGTGTPPRFAALREEALLRADGHAVLLYLDLDPVWLAMRRALWAVHDHLPDGYFFDLGGAQNVGWDQAQKLVFRDPAFPGGSSLSYDARAGRRQP